MPLRLNTPKEIKTGFRVEEVKLGEVVVISSLIVRMREKTIVVEYQIASTDGKRDHNNTVTIPFDALDKPTVKRLLKDVYEALALLPQLGAGVVSDDKV